MDVIKIAHDVFDAEINQLKILKDKIGKSFCDVIDCILKCDGKVIVTGIGKSGIIGRKISASLASTGTQSFFLHAAEALHGDLGMVSKDDIVIAISNSGSSQEVLNMLPSLKKIGCVIVAMTGDYNSLLAEKSDYILNVGVEKEACPIGLAPTSSTTATLLMGDALVVALMKRRDFKPENFALYHPGGTLGRRLLTKVKDLMCTNIPRVHIKSTLKDIIYEISSKKVGMTTVYDDNEKIVGIITDGDIRRNIFDTYGNLKDIKSEDIMIENFKRINSNEMANMAWEKMNQYSISCLPVIDGDNIVGIISMHDVFDFKDN